MAARSVKDALTGGRLKRFIDRRLIMALSHPLREHVLAVANERVASASEIGREIDLEVPAFYHHVEVLERLGCIERVEATPARRRPGPQERFFRAKATMLFGERDWRRVPATVRSDVVVSYIQSILDDVERAVRNGMFALNPSTHISWLPAVFDRRGWEESLALMNETLARTMEIQRRSGERIAVTGESGFPATIALMGFETASVCAARSKLP